MDTQELLNQAGLRAEWAHEFVVESNMIDPQPGPDGPGSVLYDAHTNAVLYAIRMASEDRYALPKVVHELLLPDHPLAGKLRTIETKIGLNDILPAAMIQFFFWRWNREVHTTIDDLRTDDDSIDEEDKISRIWQHHSELMNIRPFELYNGKVGRVLMVNHALLVDINPWIVPCKTGREDYFDLIRTHPSARWGTHPEEIQGLHDVYAE